MTAQPPVNNTAELTTQEVSQGLPFIENPAIALVLKIIGAIFVVLILIIASRRIAKFVRQKLTSHTQLGIDDNSQKIANLVGDIVFYTLLIFSFFIGFEILGFDVGLILGGVSFGIGLAFKESLGNLIAGIMILSTRQIKIGDIIEVTDNNETFFGRIEEITIRNTVIRTLDMRQVVLPNMTIISKPIKTYSSEEIVRLDNAVQVDYTTDLDLAQKVMVEAINTLPFVLEQDRTKTIVWSFDDSGITIKYYFYFDPRQGLLAEYAIGFANEKVNKAFKENNISIPFPHRTLITKEGSHPINIESINIKQENRIEPNSDIQTNNV